MSVKTPVKVGHTECIVGSMYSGKTLELQRRYMRLQYAGKKVIAFKPKIDNRYSDSQVVSHSGQAIDCIVVNDVREVLNHIDDTISGVFLEEAQFFDMSVIEVIEKLNSRGIIVVVAGLDMYSSGEPFGPMPFIMAKAKYVDKLHAVCVNCGEDAYISHAIKTNENTNKESKVKVGSAGEYIALCENCRANY